MSIYVRRMFQLCFFAVGLLMAVHVKFGDYAALGEDAALMLALWAYYVYRAKVDYFREGVTGRLNDIERRLHQQVEREV